MRVAAPSLVLLTGENPFFESKPTMLTPIFQAGSRRALTAVATLGLFSVQALSVSAQEKPELPPLTPSQLEAIQKQIEMLQNSLKDTNLKRNGSAEAVFRAAGADPKKAKELYLQCYQEVNFNSIGKSASDFREWEEGQESRLNLDPFLNALQMQLVYLSLVTRAAQQEDISTIFGDLTKFMASIQGLSEPPHPYLDGSVANSIFAQAYDLDELLARKNETWEMNPMNIGGVYEKTILPFLRVQRPEQLDTAWTSRIQQEANMARLFLAFEDEMERYQRNNEGMDNRQRQQIAQMANYVRQKALAAAEFESDTLPNLQWERLKDQYNYVNRAVAAKAMLDHIQANITHQDAEEWIKELTQLTSVNTQPTGVTIP